MPRSCPWSALAPGQQPLLALGSFQASRLWLRKGVANLFRHPEVSVQAIGRYLEVLRAIDNPTPGKQALWRLTPVQKDVSRPLSGGPALCAAPAP